MKTLVVFLGLFLSTSTAFALGHTIENYESSENRERVKAYLSVLGQVEMIAREVMNKNVKATAKFILGGNWEKNQGPMLKKIDNTTDFWSAVMTYYESSQTLSYNSIFGIFKESDLDYAVKCDALEVVFAILDHYGNNEYKKHIEETSLYIQDKFQNNEDIYPIDLMNIEKIDKYFPVASLSDEEKYYKSLMVWMRCYFLAIEQAVVSDIKVKCEKQKYVKHAMDNEIL